MSDFFVLWLRRFVYWMNNGGIPPAWSGATSLTEPVVACITDTNWSFAYSLQSEGLRRTVSTNNLAAVSAMMLKQVYKNRSVAYSTLDHCEGGASTAHATSSLRVRNPNSCMITGSTSAFWIWRHIYYLMGELTLQQVFDTATQVIHPLLFLTLCDSVNHKRLCPWFDKKPVPRVSVIFNIFDLNFLKRYYMLAAISTFR